MDPVDPVWLILLIWSATQHYADFEAQVLGIMGQDETWDAHVERNTRFLSQGIPKRGVAQTPSATPGKN